LTVWVQFEKGVAAIGASRQVDRSESQTVSTCQGYALFGEWFRKVFNAVVKLRYFPSPPVDPRSGINALTFDRNRERLMADNGYPYVIELGDPSLEEVRLWAEVLE
jgi:hypothetical protein